MASGKELKYPTDRKYSETHEWVRLDGDLAVIGISDYAQDALGDVVFVELPSVGAQLNAGEAFGVVESVKAASDVYAPVGGTVESVNEALLESPDLVNRDALGEGWFVKVRPSNPSDLDRLLDAETYRTKIDSGELH